jgi:hypothetical protein
MVECVCEFGKKEETLSVLFSNIQPRAVTVGILIFRKRMNESNLISVII